MVEYPLVALMLFVYILLHNIWNLFSCGQLSKQFLHMHTEGFMMSLSGPPSATKIHYLASCPIKGMLYRHHGAASHWWQLVHGLQSIEMLGYHNIIMGSVLFWWQVWRYLVGFPPQNSCIPKSWSMCSWTTYGRMFVDIMEIPCRQQHQVSSLPLASQSVTTQHMGFFLLWPIKRTVLF